MLIAIVKRPVLRCFNLKYSTLYDTQHLQAAGWEPLGSSLSSFPDTTSWTLEPLIRTCQGHFVRSVGDVGPSANNNNVMSEAAVHQRALQDQ